MAQKKWTLTEIPDLAGKNILVTGGNSGLGFESCRALANRGANIIMASRNLEKAKEAREQIIDINNNANINVMKLDLADLTSVEQFAKSFESQYNSLDVLMNNAGIMMHPYSLTKDGFESQLGTNHLGHFALTGHLIDLIRSTPGSRVVNIASLAHKQGDMDFDNLLYEDGKSYGKMKAYGRSKLANLLFSYELQRYFETNKMNAISVAAHPGASMTNLFSHMLSDRVVKWLSPLLSLIVQPADMGALPQLRAATDLNAKGGEYYGPGGFGELKGFPKKVNSNRLSHNEHIAKMLWKKSESLTGVSYG